MEDLQVWIASLSSANLRSFRHVATLVWLTIMTKLCTLYVSASDSITQNQSVVDSESKRKRPNKGRLEQAKTALKMAESKAKLLETDMDDIFKTIFAHRYCDVDYRIRIDCIRQLGVWMQLLPNIYFNSRYIRYFGWLLSDVNAHMRVQVLKSLITLYKVREHISEFRHFTDRFKLRIIEMAAHDSDSNVRVAALNLLCILREIEYLAPDDIEACCRLVFDLEPRVRKVASQFLVAHAIDEAKTRPANEFSSGELTSLSKKFPELDKSWLVFREICDIFKKEQEESAIHTKSNKQTPKLIEDLSELYPSYSSRISLAGEAIWEADSQNTINWTQLISFLLFDVSTLGSKNSTNLSNSYTGMFLLDDEDIHIMLDFLYGLVNSNMKELLHLRLLSASTLGNMHKKRISNEEFDESQAEIHAELVPAIPKLLEVYSHNINSISLIIRLFNLLDLDVYTQLTSEADQKSLIETIINHFKINSDKKLLGVCSDVFAKAMKTDSSLEFRDMVETKVKELAENIGYRLRDAFQEVGGDLNDISLQDNAKLILLPALQLDALSRNLDTHKFLEAQTHSTQLAKEGSDSETGSAVIQNVQAFLNRYSKQETKQIDLALISTLVGILRSYSMWKLSEVVNAVPKEADLPSGFISSIDLSKTSVMYILCAMDTLQDMVMFSNCYHTRSISAKAIIDLFVTINVALAQISSFASSPAFEMPLNDLEKFNIFKLPHKASGSLEKMLMALFLKKEKAYGSAAEVNFESNEDDEEWLSILNNGLSTHQKKTHKSDELKDSDESDLSDLSDNDDNDDFIRGYNPGGHNSLSQSTSSQKLMEPVLTYKSIIETTKAASRKNQRIFLLDCDLCQYTAKIRMGVLAKVINLEYAKRITLNAKVLSPLFMKLITTEISAAGMVHDEPEKKSKKKRVEGGSDNAQKETGKEKDKEFGEADFEENGNGNDHDSHHQNDKVGEQPEKKAEDSAGSEDQGEEKEDVEMRDSTEDHDKKEEQDEELAALQNQDELDLELELAASI